MHLWYSVPEAVIEAVTEPVEVLSKCSRNFRWLRRSLSWFLSQSKYCRNALEISDGWGGCWACRSTLEATSSITSLLTFANYLINSIRASVVKNCHADEWKHLKRDLSNYLFLKLTLLLLISNVQDDKKTPCPLRIFSAFFVVKKKQSTTSSLMCFKALL